MIRKRIVTGIVALGFTAAAAAGASAETTGAEPASLAPSCVTDAATCTTAETAALEELAISNEFVETGSGEFELEAPELTAVADLRAGRVCKTSLVAKYGVRKNRFGTQYQEVGIAEQRSSSNCKLIDKIKANVYITHTSIPPFGVNKEASGVDVDDAPPYWSTSAEARQQTGLGSLGTKGIFGNSYYGPGTKVTFDFYWRTDTTTGFYQTSCGRAEVVIGITGNSYRVVQPLKICAAGKS